MISLKVDSLHEIQIIVLTKTELVAVMETGGPG